MIREILVMLYFFGFIPGIYCLCLREILWSIVWLNKKGKRRKLKDLKVGVPTWSRITMKYLLPYAGNYKRQFLFWYHFKRCFLMIEVILWCVDVCIIVFAPPTKPYDIALIASVVQLVIVTIFIRCQFDSRGCTKYDQMRLRGK